MQANSHAAKALARRRSVGTLYPFAATPGGDPYQDHASDCLQPMSVAPSGMYTALLGSVLQPADETVSTGPVHAQTWQPAEPSPYQQQESYAASAANYAAVRSAQAPHHHELPFRTPGLQLQPNVVAMPLPRTSQQAQQALHVSQGKSKPTSQCFICAILLNDYRCLHCLTLA